MIATVIKRLLAVSCAVSAWGCHSAAPPTRPVELAPAPAWSEWTNDRLGISLKYPATWAVRDNGQADLLLAAPPDSPDDDFIESLAITHEDIAWAATSPADAAEPLLILNRYVARALEQLSGEPNFKLLGSAATTIDTLPARRVTYLAFGPTTRGVSQPFVFDQLLILRGTTVYAVTLTCQSELAYGRYAPISRGIESTMRLRPEMKTTTTGHE
jgi:hypothetical protein